jgi:sugar phosphate isomerase/epimerase
MKYVYAFRRSAYYPFNKHGWRNLPDGKALNLFLQKISCMGFDGIELGLDYFSDHLSEAKGEASELKNLLEEFGLPCLALRGGGGLALPKNAEGNLRRLEKMVEIGSVLKVNVINTTATTESRKIGAGSERGGKNPHGSSRDATHEDFERLAASITTIGEIASGFGIIVSLEVHQNSIIDNSWSALHFLNMVESRNVFLNPDLGNVLWNYDIPEENLEDCIVALAPHSKYWHCKNLQRIYLPEVGHSYFVRCPLPDGDIDYRYAIGAMLDAKFDGYIAIEGATDGDFITKDLKSLMYMKKIVSESN